jgi:hypothetical protein
MKVGTALKGFQIQAFYLVNHDELTWVSYLASKMSFKLGHFHRSTQHECASVVYVPQENVLMIQLN